MYKRQNRDLLERVNEGAMRRDFYYRIHVIPIHLPPLRERKADIPLLVEHFLKAYPVSYTHLDVYKRQHHVLEGIHIYMSIYSIGKNRYSQEAIDICSFIQPMLIDTFNSILLYNDMNALKHSFIAERHPSANKNIKEKYELSSSGDAFPTLDTIIIDHIKMAIAKANGKIAGPDGAANLLGLNTSTLWSKIRKYNIDPKTLTE